MSSTKDIFASKEHAYHEGYSEASNDPTQRDLAYHDLIAGLKQWRIWTMLAYQDIKLRYRRSVLGPFWITLSMAITVYSMGYLYSHLFHQDLSVYYPFLVSGMLTWTFISSVITDVADGLVASEGLIKQLNLPYSLYLYRIGYRNLLIFLHNWFVMIPIMIIFHKTSRISISSLLVLPGLLLIFINCISYGLIISMIGARFRDVSQVIKSLLQVVFFLTPVMWMPSVLGVNKQFLVNYNPLYALIEIIREPLLGLAPSLHSVVFSTFITIFGFIVCIKFFSKYRVRIIYWL